MYRVIGIIYTEQAFLFTKNREHVKFTFFFKQSSHIFTDRKLGWSYFLRFTEKRKYLRLFKVSLNPVRIV